MLSINHSLHRHHVVAGMPDQRLFAMVQVRPDYAVEVVAEPLAVVFVIDGSRSMSEGDRGALVVSALRHLSNQPVLRTDDRVGIVRFSDQASVVLPLTPWRDKTAFSEALDGLQRWRGGTALGAGLRRAAEMLESSRGGCRIVLLTDGEAQDSADALHEAKGLGARRTPVTAIGVGNDWNDDLLLTIADLTRGLPCHIVPDGYGALLPSVALSGLPAVLAAELQHASATVVAELALWVTPSPGIVISRVTRVFPTVHEAGGGGHAPYLLGAIELGTTTTFVLEFILPALAPGPAAIAHLELAPVPADEAGGDRLSPIELEVTVTTDVSAAGAISPSVMRAVQQRNLEGLVQQAAEEARRDPARARQLLDLARDLTVKLGNDAMTGVVDQALGHLDSHKTLSPGVAKRLRVGGKTATVALAGLEGAPPEELIRRITGV